MKIQNAQPVHAMSNSELRKAIMDTHEMLSKSSLRNLQAEMYMNHCKALMDEELRRAQLMVTR